MSAVRTLPPGLDSRYWRFPLRPAAPDRWKVVMSDGHQDATFLEVGPGSRRLCLDPSHRGNRPYLEVASVEPFVDGVSSRWVLEVCGHVIETQTADAEAGEPQFCVDCNQSTWVQRVPPVVEVPAAQPGPVRDYQRIVVVWHRPIGQARLRGRVHRVPVIESARTLCGTMIGEGGVWSEPRTVVVCPLHHDDLCKDCFTLRP